MKEALLMAYQIKVTPRQIRIIEKLFKAYRDLQTEFKPERQRSLFRAGDSSIRWNYQDEIVEIEIGD